MLEAAKKYQTHCSHPMIFETMVTGEQFIEDEKRNEIMQRFNPLSVDMESASIAHVCYVNQIPFLSIRTITDTAKHKGIANFESNCEKASKISCEITLGIIKSLM